MSQQQLNFDHSDEAYSLIRVKTTLNHIRFVFTSISTSERGLKKALRDVLTLVVLSLLL